MIARAAKFDPARNIPDLLDDAWHKRCFRQRHPEEYRDAEDRSISPGDLVGAQQLLHEIGTIRNDSIDLTRRDPLDFVRFVDRPCIDLVPTAMKCAYDAARTELPMDHDLIRAAPMHGDKQWNRANRSEHFSRNPSSNDQRATRRAMTGGKTDRHCWKGMSQPPDRARIRAGDMNDILKLMALD